MPSPERRRVVADIGMNDGIGYHILSSLTEAGYRVDGVDINCERCQTHMKTKTVRAIYDIAKRQ